VVALARALEAKDPATAQHSARVGRLAEATARAMGLSPAFRRGLRLAGELHDVGKIGVPDHLLRRPGRLSPSEHREVLQHAVIGERILAPLLPDREMVLATVRSHHEHFDGTGFPDGLRGGDIPLAARIVAVADAFDAMTSARPYRASLPRAAAVRELRRGAGSQWDPACVEALLRALQPCPRVSPRPGVYRWVGHRPLRRAPLPGGGRLGRTVGDLALPSVSLAQPP